MPGVFRRIGARSRSWGNSSVSRWIWAASVWLNSICDAIWWISCLLGTWQIRGANLVPLVGFGIPSKQVGRMTVGSFNSILAISQVLLMDNFSSRPVDIVNRSMKMTMWKKTHPKCCMQGYFLCKKNIPICWIWYINSPPKNVWYINSPKKWCFIVFFVVFPKLGIFHQVSQPQRFEACNIGSSTREVRSQEVVKWLGSFLVVFFWGFICSNIQIYRYPGSQPPF